jgi:hypothetical protein
MRERAWASADLQRERSAGKAHPRRSLFARLFRR